MPLSRRVLYVCFVLLALLALLQFDLKLLIPILVVISIQTRFERMITPFGYKSPRARASQPRDTGDPVVRAYLLVGGILLIAGLAGFLGFPFGGSGIGPLSSILPKWFNSPGVQAMLLGAVLMALGFDLLKGGLWRPWGELQRLVSQDPIMAEKPGLFRYIAPWLALAWVADLGGWPNLAQAIVGLIGLGVVKHLTKDWPLFAALAAPAVAFYGWTAIGHAKSAFGSANPLVFVIGILAMGIGFSMVVTTLGSAITAVLDAIKRGTWKREPWLRQAALGVAACVLAASAHTHFVERRAHREAAEQAAREAEMATASRAAAAEQSEAQAQADVVRAEADALVPGISCSYSTGHKSFFFKNQHKNPEPGIPGKVDLQLIGKDWVPRDPPREARVLEASVDLSELRQHADADPILSLPSGEVVFMSPTGARLLMFNLDGRVLHLASFHESLLKYTPVACASENGTRWVVALGPVVKVFERPAPEALPQEVNEKTLDNTWFP